ncbi:MAG: sodium:proton exchanger [Omnitrophica WOR_2 bacterium RIFCSPHIGHO2_01_FULL_48_9]|nr:MAG: sodium:proton exchanger [Omnitrophica WOR_2 bacterium RIFCSPHIGHO2_02_FULL_48_11]OGX31462.1 MAG: sodium:proton exchanger [Omnitrophica WOR_2 bacterium RIFCSPHIGHO2_01_FULL_48_9]
MSTHFLSTIEFQMSLLLFVALAGYLLAARINQSAVIGEILVGLIIGPSFLGLITYTDFVQSLAHLGAIILLFVVGFEFKIKEVFNLRYGVIALVGVVVPWIGGYYTAKLFGYSFGNAVFVGTALTATSIAITANVLKEMNKLQTPAAQAIIGAAVIDDVLSLLALSLSNEIVFGTLSFSTILIPLIKAVLFLVIGAYLGGAVFTPLIEKIDQSSFGRKYPEFVFIFAMMLAFFYAAIAELLGLSGIVGAFLAGISFGGAMVRHGKSHKEGAEYLHIIFASIFFVSLGVLVDIKLLTLNSLVFLMVLTVVAIVTKVVGCSLPALWQGLSKRDAAIIGLGMSPRGEVAMIIGLIGLREGIINQDIYAAIIAMSLITTIFTPIVLRNWFYKESI